MAFRGLFNAFVVSVAWVASASCSHAEPQTLSVSAALVAREFQKDSPHDDVNTRTTSAAAPLDGACPEGMVLIDGAYCPEVEQTCLEWMDAPGSTYAHFRCKRYQSPSVCKGEKTHMRYCIDRTERTTGDAANTPKNFVSFFAAKEMCAAAGGRVCRESEWQFACEGEEMRPYPYGYERDETACNTDRFTDLRKNGRLVDHRSPAGSHARCASPFGVQDLAGNMEEWVAADGASKMGWKQVLKGSWWIPSRHACRQFQVGHGPEYSGAEIGTRCCKDL
jgi:formylglycine-generating enzyme